MRAPVAALLPTRVGSYHHLAEKALVRSLELTSTRSLHAAWNLYLYRGSALFALGHFDEAKALLETGIDEAEEMSYMYHVLTYSILSE